MQTTKITKIKILKNPISDPKDPHPIKSDQFEEDQIKTNNNKNTNDNSTRTPSLPKETTSEISEILNSNPDLPGTNSNNTTKLTIQEKIILIEAYKNTKGQSNSYIVTCDELLVTAAAEQPRLRRFSTPYLLHTAEELYQLEQNMEDNTIPEQHENKDSDSTALYQGTDDSS